MIIAPRGGAGINGDRAALYCAKVLTFSSVRHFQKVFELFSTKSREKVARFAPEPIFRHLPYEQT